MNKSFKNQLGFTLIELCIVMIIVSLMVAGAVQAYTIYDEKQRIVRANNLMSDIRLAFDKFPRRYIPSTITADADGRLTGTYYERMPRPAPLNSAGAGNDFGAEVAEGDVNAAVASGNLIRVTGTAGVSVLIGKFPAATLELSNDYMKDVHGNYLIYAVTENATMDSKSVGAITVIEEGIDHRVGQPTSGHIIEYDTHPNVQYVVVSMGQNGAGAYAFDGTQSDCPDNDVKEAENCNFSRDNDATFRMSLLSELGSNTTNDGYYDDMVVFETAVDNEEPAFKNLLRPAVPGVDFAESGSPYVIGQDNWTTRGGDDRSMPIKKQDYEIKTSGYLEHTRSYRNINSGGANDEYDNFGSGIKFKLNKGDTVSLIDGRQTAYMEINGEKIEIQRSRSGEMTVKNADKFDLVDPSENFVFSNPTSDPNAKLVHLVVIQGVVVTAIEQAKQEAMVLACG